MSYYRALMAILGAAEGRARRLAYYRHFHAEREPIFLLFWRPGGEEGRIAAVSWAVGRRPMQIMVAGDARNWDLQAGLLHEFAVSFNPLFESPASVRLPDGESRMTSSSAPQFVVPNTTTVTFMHRAAQFAKTLPPALRTPEIERMSQHLDFLYEMNGSPGQSLLLVMTEILNFHNAIPLTSPERQSLAAAEATISHTEIHYSEALTEEERLLFGPLPATADERAIYNKVRDFNLKRVGATDRAMIAPLLKEIEKDYRDLSDESFELLRKSYYREAGYSEAPSVASRWLEDRRRYTWQVDRVDEGRYFGLEPSPGHAFRWMRRMEGDGDVFAAQSACDDPGLIAEHLASGNAVKGVVVLSDLNHFERPNVRSVRRPRITIKVDAHTLLPPPGQEFWLSAHPQGPAWAVESTDAPRSGARVITFKLTTSGKTIPIPSPGDKACFITFSANRGPLMPLPKRKPHAFQGA